MQLIVDFSQDRCYEVTGCYLLNGMDDSALALLSQGQAFVLRFVPLSLRALGGFVQVPSSSLFRATTDILCSGS